MSHDRQHYLNDIIIPINFHGLTLLVRGDYIPAEKGTDVNPPVGAEFKITQIALRTPNFAFGELAEELEQLVLAQLD